MASPWPLTFSSGEGSSIQALALAKFYALPFKAFNQIWKLSVIKSALPMHWLCFGNPKFPTKTMCVGKLTTLIWPTKPDVPGWNVDLTALIWPIEPGVPGWHVDLSVYKFLSLWVGRWFHTEWCDDCMHGVSVIWFTAVTALSSVAFNSRLILPSTFFILFKINSFFYTL